MKSTRPFALGFLGTILLSATGCGFIFSKGPPIGHEQMNFFSCTEGNVGPILDLVWGGLNVLGAVSAISDPDNIRLNTEYEPGTVIAVGLGWGVLSTASALSGFGKSSRCRAARAALAIRLSQRDDGEWNPAPAIAWIVVSPATYTLQAMGEQVQLSATAYDSGGTTVADGTFSWSSSDYAIASVDDKGLVTARASGSAEIVARAGDATWKATVVVVPER